MTDAQKKTAGIAITSLVFGILGLACLGPFGAIPAVICGHVAKSRIKASAGLLEGDGLALAGLVLGYVSIGLMVVLLPIYAAIAIPSFLRARLTSQQNACIGNLRQIEAAKDQYALENGLTNLQSIGASDTATFGLLVDGTAGYIKAFPLCPASTNISANPRTAALSAADYIVNPVGSNCACLRVPATHVLSGN